MTTLLLNIGLNNIPNVESYTNGQANPWIAKAAMTAAQALRRHGFVYGNNRVVHSDTEPTLVIEVTTDGMAVDNRIEMVANALNQDCIAVWYSDEGVGDLIGPRAADWGAFDPSLFFTLAGTRMAA